MNSNLTKLILLDYDDLDYIPELGGQYIQNLKIKNSVYIPYAICPITLDINLFLTKYNLFSKCKTYSFLLFYMNLLNFNGFSDWKPTDKQWGCCKFNLNNSYYQSNLLETLFFIYREL